MKVIIVGGVAGGASCAARLRRLDETAEVMMVERGPYISYANCGLPYHVGGVIEHESSLLVTTAESFRDQFAIDVRTNCAAIEIAPARREVALRDGESGAVTWHGYDKLVLSPGAVPVRPPLPGIDLPGIFSVRTVPDARTIRTWIESCSAAAKPGARLRAVVVGGGFIGLEMVENLVHRGIAVTLIELLDQVLPPLDVEHARAVEGHLARHGVGLALGDSVTAFGAAPDGAIAVHTKSGTTHMADLVILALGVRPDVGLARTAGLALGERGGIRVDAHMQTSDPDILAVGDAVEVRDTVTGTMGLVALAGPANRQGRIAADVIAGRASRYRGTQGTAVVGVFGWTVAWTGAAEKALIRAGIADYEKVYLFPNQHARYYPGAKPISMKVLFRRSDGRLLGAQAIGEEGVERRIDVIAAFIQKEATIYDLEEAELCYAPQYGGAKDAVNFAGMVAADVLRGDMPLTHWPLIHWPSAGTGVLLDVREPAEIAADPVPGAIAIPVRELRKRLAELPRGAELSVICRSGQRAYLATRILVQNGFAARTISGGMLARREADPSTTTPAARRSLAPNATP